MWKSIKLDKYLEYRLSLETYLEISDIILEDNLDLNLYVVLTTCYTVIISESQGFSEKGFLVEVLVSLGWDLS